MPKGVYIRNKPAKRGRPAGKSARKAQTVYKGKPRGRPRAQVAAPKRGRPKGSKSLNKLTPVEIAARLRTLESLVCKIAEVQKAGLFDLWRSSSLNGDTLDRFLARFHYTVTAMGITAEELEENRVEIVAVEHEPNGTMTASDLNVL